MSKQEEIEGLIKVIEDLDLEIKADYAGLYSISYNYELSHKIANGIYNAGYRKAPELEARIRELVDRWEKLRDWFECGDAEYPFKLHDINSKMRELGKGEQESVCEWVKDKEGVYHAECVTQFFKSTGKIKERKYCPYCGKPIKIKEGK